MSEGIDLGEYREGKLDEAFSKELQDLIKELKGSDLISKHPKYALSILRVLQKRYRIGEEAVCGQCLNMSEILAVLLGLADEQEVDWDKVPIEIFGPLKCDRCGKGGE